MPLRWSNAERLLTDPVTFQQLCWPDLRLYDKQIEILESVRDNDETVVPAGNKLGKDFIAGFIALWFFCSRSPAKVVTTSSSQPQLKAVMWGEIRRFINTSKYQLPIQYNDLLIRQLMGDGTLEPRSYLQGLTSNEEENLQGHHLELGEDGKARTLAIFDEASSIDTKFYNAADTWAHKKLIIGNPLPCVNFFFKKVKLGDVQSEEGDRYYTKVIKVQAMDSPNVRLGQAQEKLGKKPTHEILVPGVVDYALYKKRRATWDPIRQTIGLDGEFYEGAEVRLYPPEWLARAQEYAATLGTGGRKAAGLGVDPGQGGDDTVWTVVDLKGIIEQIAKKTPDTTECGTVTLALMKKYGIPPEKVCFDIGGGGKEHADYLRRDHDLPVRTVGFGQSASDPDRYKRMRTSAEKEQATETAYTYKNRRAEMYGLLRTIMEQGDFAISATLTELLRQLAVFPLQFDSEGRMYLPPKDKPTPQFKGTTIKEMLGCSPDEADSLVLAVYAMRTGRKKFKVH